MKIKKELLEIAKENSAAVNLRGDLERRWSDQDFIEVSVWALKAMLEDAYELGKREKKED